MSIYQRKRQSTAPVLIRPNRWCGRMRTTPPVQVYQPQVGGGVIGVSVLRYHPPKVVDKTIISQKTLKQDWLNPMIHVEHHRITGPNTQKPSTLKKILPQ